MKKLLRLISVLTATVLMLTMVSASATEFSEWENISTDLSIDLSAIAKHLSYVEVVKDNYEMGDVDFNSIIASNTVYAYEYTSSGTEKVLDFVPLMYEGELIAWVMVSTAGDEPLYQFTTSFVDEARELLAEGKEIAFVYSYDACYLYDGSTLYLLNEITEDERVESRKVISSVEQMSSCDVILSSPDVVYDLPDIVSADGAVVPTESYVLNVGYVYQGFGTKICWAACTACITNYLKGTSYTAEEIAIARFGTDYDYSVSGSTLAAILYAYTGYSFTSKSTVPSATDLVYNLSRNYPLVAMTKSTASDHAVVVYGIYITETTPDYIYVMDPSGYPKSSALTLATYNSSSETYSFICATDLLTYTVYGGICRYWV